MTLRDEANALSETLVQLRRAFHQHPEPSLQEHRTARRIEEELDKLGIPHRRFGETGVFGVLNGTGTGSGVVLLRADIDALPIQETNDVPYRSQTDGVCHACGHDAHTACLLGGVMLLARHRADFGGEVRLVFQPGEEIGKGATPFLVPQVMEGVERVFGLHTAPDLPAGSIGLKPGPNNAGVDFFRITVQGKSAHVSTPQLGVDALYIASHIAVALQEQVARRFSPIEPLIIGVGKLQAGTTYNALAASAVLEGTTRTMTNGTRQQARDAITATAQEIAILYGGTAEVYFEDYATPLLNNAQVCQEAGAVIDQLFGPGRVRTDRTLSLSGDNFADFIQDVPGAYAYLGTANPNLPGTLHPAHNGNFDIDESALSLGAGAYAGYALWWLTHIKD